MSRHNGRDLWQILVGEKNSLRMLTRHLRKARPRILWHQQILSGDGELLYIPIGLRFHSMKIWKSDCWGELDLKGENTLHNNSLSFRDFSATSEMCCTYVSGPTPAGEDNRPTLDNWNNLIHNFINNHIHASWYCNSFSAFSQKKKMTINRVIKVLPVLHPFYTWDLWLIYIELL